MNHEPFESNTQLDRTLRALGSAEPSAEFAARLISSLEQQRAEARKTTTMEWLRGFAVRGVLAGAGAAACAAMVAGVLLHRETERKHQPQVLTPSRQQAVALETRKSRDDAPKQTSLHKSTPALPQRLSSTGRDVGYGSVFYLAAVSSASGDVSVETDTERLDRQALADFQVPSQPAPPLPLTAQERLVRLMLRRGERHELAQLDPVNQDAFAQSERAAFRQFFDPPPPPKPPDSEPESQPATAQSANTQPNTAPGAPGNATPGDPQ